MPPRLPIAITAGDPCGIGPEVILRALTHPALISLRHQVVVIGDGAVFERTAAQLGQSWETVRRHTQFLDCAQAGSFPPGRASRRSGAAALAYVDYAVALWQAGQIGALVTGPVTKWAVQQGHPTFVGHTEYLAKVLGVRDVAMMFVSDHLRIVLLTRHLPLQRVTQAISPGLVRTTIRLTIDSLRRQFGIRRPRLAVCGVNPHAGEGALSSVERRVLEPVLRALRGRGAACDGPVAADGFFGSGSATSYDAIVCAYHDQGLIPFKLMARDQGCQFSAGLPLIRTSPDHGSALDIAGKGIANPGSMIYAIKLAARLATTNSGTATDFSRRMQKK